MSEQERRGHPVAGWLIGVATVLVTVGPLVALGVASSYMEDVTGLNLGPAWGIGLPVAAVLLTLGLRWATRVAAGHRDGMGGLPGTEKTPPT